MQEIRTVGRSTLLSGTRIAAGCRISAVCMFMQSIMLAPPQRFKKRPRSNAISTHHRLDENSSKRPNNSHLSDIARDSMLTEYDSDRTDESRTKTSDKTLRAVAKHFDQCGLLA